MDTGEARNRLRAPVLPRWVHLVIGLVACGSGVILAQVAGNGAEFGPVDWYTTANIWREIDKVATEGYIAQLRAELSPIPLPPNFDTQVKKALSTQAEFDLSPDRKVTPLKGKELLLHTVGQLGLTQSYLVALHKAIPPAAGSTADACRTELNALAATLAQATLAAAQEDAAAVRAPAEAPKEDPEKARKKSQPR